jgi:hypothetical protein
MRVELAELLGERAELLDECGCGSHQLAQLGLGVTGPAERGHRLLRAVEPAPQCNSSARRVH